MRKDYQGAERLYRKALELAPNDANNNSLFALFMESVRKDYEEAERLYRQALVLDPNDATNIGSFAVFIVKVHKDYQGAERLYRKALELDPSNANNIGNFAQFLGVRDRPDEAYDLAIRAWQLLNEVPGSNHAEIAFTRWLLGRALGRDGTPALGRLKTLLHGGFLRISWSFDELLATLVPHLAEYEQNVAHKLAEALLDENKVAALDNEPVWKAVEPIPLDIPWPS